MRQQTYTFSTLANQDIPFSLKFGSLGLTTFYSDFIAAQPPLSAYAPPNGLVCQKTLAKQASIIVDKNMFTPQF
jgi:hypothetical protein